MNTNGSSNGKYALEISNLECYYGSFRAVKDTSFEIERQNIAIPDDNGFNQQVGDQRSRGIELELAMELARGLHGLLVYGYTDSVLTRFTESVLVAIDPPTYLTIDRSGNTAASIPTHRALATHFFSPPISSTAATSSRSSTRCFAG